MNSAKRNLTIINLNQGMKTVYITAITTQHIKNILNYIPP